MVSTKAVRQALYERLNTASITTLLTDGSAGIVHGIARPQTRFPYLMFAKQSGTSRLRFGGNAYDDHVWLVKGVCVDSTSSIAEDIAAAVAARLDFASLTISGGSLMFMARVSDVDYFEPDGDQTYRHHGALYRLSVQS